MCQDDSETPVSQRDLFEEKGQNMYLCFRISQIISVLYMFLGVCSLCLESVLPTAQQQAKWPELIQQHMIGQLTQRRATPRCWLGTYKLSGLA